MRHPIRPPGSLRRIRLAPAVLVLVVGCGRAPAPPESRAPSALPVSVYADTGRSTRLHVAPPDTAALPQPAARASVWLASVSPARTAPADLPAGEPVDDTLAVTPPPPALRVDQGLKPPLPRTEAPLVVPAGARGSVELEVRVDEQGTVSEARWVAGSRDSALVRAAIDCARAMRFFPAERAGSPVAVWCRQRFDFGGAEP